MYGFFIEQGFACACQVVAAAACDCTEPALTALNVAGLGSPEGDLNLQGFFFLIPIKNFFFFPTSCGSYFQLKEIL